MLANAAYSDNPSPIPLKVGQPPQTQSKESEQRSTAYQRGTEKFPIVVKVISAQKTQEEAKQHAKEREEETSINRGIEIFTGILAFVAFLQFIWMVRQEKWMRRNVRIAKESADTARSTVETMKDTAQRQLRAYVGIESITINKFGDSDVPEVHIIFKNTGLTPAYINIKTTRTAILMREFPISGDFPDFPPINSSIQSSQSVIGAGGVVQSIAPTARPLSDAENSSVRDGTGAIYVFGEITYKDVFGISRFTKFRLYYGGDAGARADGLMKRYEGDNEAN